MDPIKEAMIREDDTGEVNPALDPYRERPSPHGPLTPMGMARELVEKWHVRHFGLKIDAWKLELLASRIAELMVANTMEAVRGFEDYNAMSQRQSIWIENMRHAALMLLDECGPTETPSLGAVARLKECINADAQ